MINCKNIILKLLLVINLLLVTNISFANEPQIDVFETKKTVAQLRIQIAKMLECPLFKEQEFASWFCVIDEGLLVITANEVTDQSVKRTEIALVLNDYSGFAITNELHETLRLIKFALID